MARMSASSARMLSRGRLFGLALLILGVALLLLALDAQMSIDEIGTTDEPALQDSLSRLEARRDLCLVTAIGIIFLGLFSMAILDEPSVPNTVSADQMVAMARVSGGILSGLSLAGNSQYLPAKHGLRRESTFVPATKGRAALAKVLTEDLVLSPGKDGSTPGIIVEPLGLALLDSAEAELRTSISDAGLQSAEGTLQILKHGFGVLKDFHFKERDGKIVLRVEQKSLLDACRTVRRERPDTCRQMQCVSCSCLLTAVARATGRAVSVEEVDNSTDMVVFVLDLREW